MTLRSKVAMYDTRRILLPIHLPDAIAGTAANYGMVFITPADDRYIFAGVEVIFTTQAGAACTLTVERCQGTEAPGAGNVILAATIDMEGAEETPHYGSIAGVAVADRTLADGDRIGLVIAGTPAALRNVQVTIELEELIPIRAKEAPTERERIIVSAILYGAQPQTAAMYDKFFTASKRCQVIACREVHTTASGSGTGRTQLERLQGVEVPGTGDDLLTDNAGTGFLNNSAAETPLDGTIIADGTQILEVGDRLALDPVDAQVGALAGLCVTVELEALE